MAINNSFANGSNFDGQEILSYKSLYVNVTLGLCDLTVLALSKNTLAK
jgi:hypothetical protein